MFLGVFFHFAKNYEVLCFISFPKMILLLTAALTFNLDEKADKRYGRFTTLVLLLSSLGLCGQVHGYPHQVKADGYWDLIMGNGELDTPFG